MIGRCRAIGRGTSSWGWAARPSAPWWSARRGSRSCFTCPAWWVTVTDRAPRPGPRSPGMGLRRCAMPSRARSLPYTNPREGLLILGFSERSESDSLVAHRRFAMRAGIALREDYDAAQLRSLAKATRNAGQSRRLLALAEIYDGGSRTKAAQVGGVGLQTVRDWVVRFNARGPEGLIDGKAPGNTCKLNDSQRQAVAAMVENGPMPAIHGVVRWRLKDLTLWVWEAFRISISETTLSRELRALGYRKLSARPRHYAQDLEAQEAFKKVSRPPWRRSGRASRTAPRSSCGGRTRRGWARRTRSRAAGPDEEPGPAPRTTRGRTRSTSSGRSAPRRARAQPWCCPDATRRP